MDNFSQTFQESLRMHADELLTWAQKTLSEALGTKALPIPKNMEAPFMRVVGLPALPENYQYVFRCYC